MNTGEHYFAQTPRSRSAPRSFTVLLKGRQYSVTTDSGVFSPQHLDKGTAVLLDHVPTPPPSGNLLDLGCGWGPLTLSLANLSPQATVWAVDVNDRALELTRSNTQRAGCTNVTVHKPHEVSADIRFDAIWSNPPIRIGKAALHSLLMTWLPRLKHGASAWLVVQRHLGSDSLQRWLAETLSEHYEVSRATSSASYRVLHVRRSPR